MKTRLLGAAVLFVLAAIFLPMIFSGKSPTPGEDQSVSLAIPPAPDRDLQTRTMSLTPDAAGSSAPAQPSGTVVTPGSGSQLATVNIASQRPGDVGSDAGAVQKAATDAASAGAVTTGSGASPGQPVIPMQHKPDARATPPKPIAKAGVQPKPTVLPAKPATADELTAAGGRSSYTINLSAYASSAGAGNLERRVRALGYPVAGHPLTQAGQQRTLVIAGPFATRTAAEAARLKIIQSIPGVPARLEQGVSAATATPSAAASVSHGKPQAGGWAVQLAAMSSQADANALRDKLRAAGFDGFVDSVVAGGKRLWRVRAGPQTQRADAQRVHDQIQTRLGINGNIVPVP